MNTKQKVGITNYKGVIGSDWDFDAYVNNVVLDQIPTKFGDSFNNNNGIFMIMSWITPRKFKDVTDGLSKTLAMGEQVFNPNWAACGKRTDLSGHWGPRTYMWALSAGGGSGAPVPLNLTDEKTPWASLSSPTNSEKNGFNSKHPGGVFFLVADGAVRFVKDTIALTTLRALFSMNGGETATDF